MSGVADRPQRWSRSESCVARAGCPPPDRRESTDSGGAPWVRLPTSWELCRPVGAPAYGYVLSATLLSGPSPIRGCLVPSNSAAAKAIGLSVLGQGGVWTHSSATNRRESRGQPKDRDSQGGPDRMRLAQTSGEAGARCHLWVYRAVYGRWPPSMRSGNSTVSTHPPSAPVLRMRLIPAPERGGSMQGRGTASPCPSAGRMGPTSQRLFQLRPHAATSRRDRAANVRAGVPSAGDGRPGRPTIG